ncbi:hypothetical protein [Flammeovirga kamogawensis]|nr:hypothetical protein [Flammeovirga kamogawensis]TRX66641.1 hypothetical protein EO216_00315 [Flammeovirga kamogawensis]
MKLIISLIISFSLISMNYLIDALLDTIYGKDVYFTFQEVLLALTVLIIGLLVKFVIHPSLKLLIVRN